jgi:3-oxoacyl-[acyl-carrier-protein] synthase III
MKQPSMNELPSPAAPGITGIAYAFPGGTSTVRELASAGLLESAPDLLEEFGFRTVRTASTETPYELGLRAARDLMTRLGIEPESVGLLLYCGPQGPTAFCNDPSMALSSASHRTLARFRYPGTRMQHELGLVRAGTFGLDQLGCTTLFAAVRIARAMCASEGVERVLCVSSEFFPADAGREAIFNCTSDAAVAVLVDRTAAGNRLLSAVHVTKGYYWDPEELRDQMVASYFPTAKHVIERTLAGAGWQSSQVDWVIPHNVGERSWQILTSLAGLEHAQIWSRNIARDGHTVAGDNFINLRDALDAGAIERGQRLLLFSFGFGAHWSGLAIEA